MSRPFTPPIQNNIPLNNLSSRPQTPTGLYGSPSPTPQLGGYYDGEEFVEPPTLPWVRQRNSSDNASRFSMDSTSLHVVKTLGIDTTQKKKQRWTIHKIWLLIVNTFLFLYGLGGMVLAIITYCNLYQSAQVIVIGENVILALVLAAGALSLISSFVGYVGIMLNNRAILTIYNVLLWPCFGLIAAIGYVAYRKNKWNLSGKLSFQWHYQFDNYDRAEIQANMHCCGYNYFSDYHARSNVCFPRTLLPGCRYKYENFTKFVLQYSYICAFSLVPVHMFVIFSALLCANHINRKFGKGLPPKMYRLEAQGLIAGTPTGSSLNIYREGISRRI